MSNGPESDKSSINSLDCLWTGQTHHKVLADVMVEVEDELIAFSLSEHAVDARRRMDQVHFPS
eukprot:6104994-Amphidinium_carterae.1